MLTDKASCMHNKDLASNHVYAAQQMERFCLSSCEDIKSLLKLLDAPTNYCFLVISCTALTFG